MSQFYVLKPSKGELFGPTWAYGEKMDPALISDHTTHTCPVCHARLGMREWLPPHYLKVSSRKPEKWGDFLWGTVFPFMVSERFQTIYQAENLTGITKFYEPAVIKSIGRGKREISSLPSYSLVKVLWGGANLDDDKSGVIRKEEKCMYHRGDIRSIEQIILETDTWQKADIFEARGLPGLRIASEKFKEVAEKYDLTNIWFIPVEKYDYEGYLPGRWYIRD